MAEPGIRDVAALRVERVGRVVETGDPLRPYALLLTGKATPGLQYAPRRRRHARAVIRSFYEYHREMHGRPLINPFPAAEGAEDGRVNAHHNPMQPFRQPTRRAAYQPKEPKPSLRIIKSSPLPLL